MTCKCFWFGLLALALSASPTAAQPPARKALIIGIDGCRPDALLAANAPHLHGLIRDGCFSDKAQTVELTVSGPAWSSLLTGVDWPKHRVRDNGFKNANFEDYPHLLARFKQARPRGFAASVAHWDGIARIVTAADHASTHKTGADTARTACKVIAENDPDMVFVHFDDVDGAGHKYGFHPKEAKYLEAIGKVDELVGDLLKAVRGRKTYDREDWLVVVSTDHGGSGKGHGQNIPEHRTIFLIVSGKSAARGAIEPAPTILDIAPTVLTHLGVAIDPAWKLDGKAVGLKPPAGADAGDRPHKKVLILGIDGCRPDAIPAAKEAFTLHRLVEDGAFSDRCDVLGDRPTRAETITGPGWCSALTGVWADKHGVTDNLFQGHKLETFPSLFRRFKEARPEGSAVALVSWKPFVDFVIPPKDGGLLVRDGDRYGYQDADRAVTAAAEKLLAEGNPDLLFVYFGEVDLTGHGYGFHPKSPRYTKSLEVVDAQIGRILDAVRKRPHYAREDWLVIICTDHGGQGRGHGGGQKIPEIRTGFLLLHGPAASRDTLPARTGNVDVAVTALTHLGVRIRPEWNLDGRCVGLKLAP